MLLLGKTQKKHPRDLPPTVPDLPAPTPATDAYSIICRQMHVLPTPPTPITIWKDDVDAEAKILL